MGISGAYFRYYNNDNCIQIIKDYNLNLPVSGICNVLPYYYFDNEICPYCEDVLVGKLLSRKRKSKSVIPFCLQCKHKFSEDCCCENCVNIKKNNINKEIKRLKARKLPVLNMRDYFHLKSLLAVSKCVKKRLVLPHQNTFKNSAYSYFVRDAVFYLFEDRNLIVPAAIKNNNLNTVKDLGLRKDFPYENEWEANFDFSINEVKGYKLFDFNSKLLSPIEETWKMSAYYQVLNHYFYSLNELGLSDFLPSEAEQYIRDILDNFSIGQASTLIWISLNSVNLQIRSKFSKSNFSELFLKELLNNHWYYRNNKKLQGLPSCKYPMLFSEIFYKDFFLGNSSAWFHLLPCEQSIYEKFF